MNRLDSPQASQFPCEREGWKHVIPAALINTAQDGHRDARLLSCCRQQCKAAASWRAIGTCGVVPPNSWKGLSQITREVFQVPSHWFSTSVASTSSTQKVIPWSQSKNKENTGRQEKVKGKEGLAESEVASFLAGVLYPVIYLQQNCANLQ